MKGLKKYYYLLSLFFVFALPTIVMSNFVGVSVNLVNVIVFVTLILLIGSVWDIWATRHGSKDSVWIWQFNHKNTLGYKLFDLPLEEYLFYAFSSLYIIYMWEGIKIAIDSKDMVYFALVPLCGLWTVLAIFLPYVLKVKTDKVF